MRSSTPSCTSCCAFPMVSRSRRRSPSAGRPARTDRFGAGRCRSSCSPSSGARPRLGRSILPARATLLPVRRADARRPLVWRHGGERYKENNGARRPKGTSMMLLMLLVVLLLLALIFGIGAVIKGVIWLAIVGFIAFVVLTAAAIGASRRPARSRG